MNKTVKSPAKNPITLIAIFAGISEVAMTVTLLKLPEQQMGTFIWFVMLFPVLLVSAFFYVLLKKPEVLYAPSDYENDGTFLKSLGIENEVSEISDNVERLDQLGTVLKDYMEKLVEKVAPEESEKIIQEQNSKFSEINRFHSLLKNNLFSLLHLDLNLDPETILNAIKKSSSVRDLPMQIGELTVDKKKKERILRIVERFPKTHLDFVNLKKESFIQ